MIHSFTSHLSADEKHILDVIGAGTAVWAFLSDTLPVVLLLLTVIWTIIRIYETDTVQKLLGRKKNDESSDSN